jgi:hypothetical protein
MNKVVFCSVLVVLVLVVVGLIWWLGGYGLMLSCFLIAGLLQ